MLFFLCLCLVVQCCAKNIAAVSATGYTTPTSSCTPHCPSEWTYFAQTDSCYKTYFNMKWTDAENFCIEQGCHLASIHSQEENTFVASMSTTRMTLKDTKDLTWIGMSKINNEWVWTDGSKTNYVNWAPKQPDNPNKEYCVQIAQDQSHDGWFENWNNEACDVEMRAFVCKAKSIH